jgi:hypothetical protein
VSKEELDKAVDKLNRGKSSDIYGVTAECIAYGGEKLRNVLLNLINTSFEHCILPDLLKIGTLTPIFKNLRIFCTGLHSRVPPCRTPCSILNPSENSPFHFILVVAFL